MELSWEQFCPGKSLFLVFLDVQVILTKFLGSSSSGLGFYEIIRARSLVVSDLRSETKGSRFESGCQLCAEVNSLQ